MPGRTPLARVSGHERTGGRLNNDIVSERRQAAEWPVRVYYEDTDCGGIAYHTAYLRFAERARTEWLRRLGHNQSTLRNELGVLFAVRALEIEYRKPAVLDDELVVATETEYCGRTRLRFLQRVIRRRDDALIARLDVEVVCISDRDHRPKAVPDLVARESFDVR